MSNTDSFVDEVNEELRRDKLFATLRRWGPVALLAVLGLVGYAGYSEWRGAQARAKAEAAGDAIYAALDQSDAAARAEALQSLDAGGLVPAMLAAAAHAEAGETAKAREALTALAADPDLSPRYRDLAALKAQMLGDRDLTVLEGLAQPGRPYRLLALEQIAIGQLAAEEPQSAIDTARSVVEDAGVSPSLRDRMETLIVSLGGTLDAAQ